MSGARGYAPVAKAPRAKTKRFTRRLLRKLVVAELSEQALIRKETKAAVKRAARADLKIDAALEGCEDW